jgi:hypothetical protein
VGEPFYYYNCENLQAVRMGEWKLLLPRETGQLPFWDKGKALATPELYHLHRDPGESQDVAGLNPEVVQMLRAAADEIRVELGEFGERGSGQRPTGSAIPGAPIVSHPRDWRQVPGAMRDHVAQVLTERHSVPKMTDTRGQGKGRKR